MSVSERTRPTALAAFTTWRARQWAVAVAAALGCVILIGVPTDLIETPLFTRAVPPTWWSYPVLAVSALLAGLLVATYVNEPTGVSPRHDGRWGSVGGALTFFAVGCPVCNKVVLLALAHYILTVKNNQRNLRKQLKALPWKQVPVLATDRERGHGRTATRSLKATEIAVGIGFPHAVQVLQLTRKTRRRPGARLHTEIVYAVTSLSATDAHPQQVAGWLRGHWGIENRIH